MILKYTESRLREAVAESKTFVGVLSWLGSPAKTGGMITYIKSRIQAFGIDFSHFSGSGVSKGTSGYGNKPKPIEEILCKVSDGKRVVASMVRRAMLESGVPHVCKECGLGTKWGGRPLTLEIDHINGDGSDNSPGNVRFLCPNCHSQTPTFRSKNFSRVVSKQVIVHTRREPTIVYKIDWPSKEELTSLIWSRPRSQLSKYLGVSDSAILKRCRKLGIQVPPNGYWLRETVRRV
jgi:hypothetical protein